MFAHQLRPLLTHIHLYIDNQNAEAWSRGIICNDSNLSNCLVYVNSLLQTSCNKIQTRAYIKSEMNIDADAISRNLYVNSANLVQYSITCQMLQFLSFLVSAHETSPSIILQQLLIVLESDVFFRS
jgi:hypothetical protein